MSFGPSKPIGPPRVTRPVVAKKVVTKATAADRGDARPLQQTAKKKATTTTAVVAAASAARKPQGKPAPVVAVKPSPPPKPPTPEPEPVYDYESDFESDESVPSAEGCSSAEEHVSKSSTESENSSSEGADDDEGDDNAEKSQGNEIGSIGEGHGKLEATISEPQEEPKPEQKQTSNPRRNARSVDILSKISLNDVTVDLYRFDPEEYAALRTYFGVTTTVAHAKHVQTDRTEVSVAQQTSRIIMRDRYTSMHGGLHFHSRRAETDQDELNAERGDEDEDEVQNYSSLQNIERMFTTLNGALDRRFTNLRPGSSLALPRRNPNQHRIILELVRKAAPIFEALLEAKRLKTHRKVASGNVVRPDHQGPTDDRRLSSDVVRSFDTGKMCPEYEVKMLQATEAAPDRFVIEFWARGTYSRPMYRFSSWSLVKCVDYECRRQMMVFGGTNDGTLQMWLGDAGRCYSEILAPHQIVAPDVGRKHQLACWEIVTVKVLPMSVARDSYVEAGSENVLNQVFGLFSSGVIVVWHAQVDSKDSSSPTDGLSARLGQPNVSLVQSKVIDLNARIGSRLTYDALRSFGNLLLHDHHQMVLSSDRSVIRLSHFVESEYDPALLMQPDSDHSIVNLKRMVQATDILFVLYSNKTVRVLKLNKTPDVSEGTRHRNRKHENLPNLMLSVCTNKSCTIQSIVHDEAKRYGNTNSVTGGGRADGGTVAPSPTELEKGGSETLSRPRFHHGQQILFFGTSHPEDLLADKNFHDSSVVFNRKN